MNSRLVKVNFFLVLAIAFLLSCAGTKSKVSPGISGEEKKKEIETMLGKSREEAKGESEEDEVLRLLGISKQKEKPTTIGSLEAEVAQLEEELSKKDSVITNLKSDLSSRERKVAQLQAELESIKGKAKPTSRAPIAVDEYRMRYRDALSAYKARNYKIAIGLFEGLLATDPHNDLADNCQYWIGESYYGLGNYKQAIIEFEKVFTFTKSNKNDDAQLKLGLCYMKLGDAKRAQAELRRLLVNYPKSEYVAKAQKFLAQLQ